MGSGRGWEWSVCFPSSLSCTDCRSRRTLVCGTYVYKSATIEGLNMLFVDRRRRLPTEEQEPSTPSFQPAVNAVQVFSQEQVDFPPNPMLPGEAIGAMPQVPTSLVAPGGAQMPSSPFVGSALSPSVTGQLVEPQTGNLPTMTLAPVASRNITTSLRQPMVIRGFQESASTPATASSIQKRTSCALCICGLFVCITYSDCLSSCCPCR